MDKVALEEIQEKHDDQFEQEQVLLKRTVMLWLLVMLQVVHMNNPNCLSISDFDIGRVLISLIFHLSCHFGCNLACVSTDNLPEQRSKHENVYYNTVSVVWTKSCNEVSLVCN